MLISLKKGDEMSSSPKNPKMNADRNGSACSIFRIRQEALGLKHMKEDPK